MEVWLWLTQGTPWGIAVHSPYHLGLSLCSQPAGRFWTICLGGVVGLPPTASLPLALHAGAAGPSCPPHPGFMGGICIRCGAFKDDDLHAAQEANVALRCGGQPWCLRLLGSVLIQRGRPLVGCG